MSLCSIETINRKGESITFNVDGNVGYDLNDHTMFVNDAQIIFNDNIS